MINSARPVEVVRAAVKTARQHGASLYSVATPSIPVDDRIKLLLAHGQITVMNLAEFKELADALGIACPDDEKPYVVPGVAEALDELRQRVFTRHVVITLGGVGMVIYDSRKGIIAHLSLTNQARAQVRDFLRPENIVGMGDEAFGSICVAYEFSHCDESQSSRVVHAARQAWRDVLQGKSLFLSPCDQWFQTRVYRSGSQAEARLPLSVIEAAWENVSWTEQVL